MQSKSFYQLSGLLSLLGLLALLAGLIVMVALPGIRYAAWALLALGVLLLAAAFIIDFRKVSGAITGRRGRFSTGSTVMTSIFIGITLLVNAISIGNYQRFDVTGVSQFTLTSQTKDVLGKMESPVQAIGFFVPGDPYGIGVDIASYARNMLTEYQNFTDQLSIKEIDPDEHPDQANQYNITQYQTVVFESDKGRRVVPPSEIITFDTQGIPTGIEAEHAFTSAILEVTGIAQKKVYFITGHGETGIYADYSQARQGLLDNLYNIDTLDLVVTPGIPEDASALIIVGPRRSLASSEVEIIKGYLENNGWLMILLNPGSPPEFKQLISDWGIDIEDGTVIDPSSYVSPSIDSPIVPRTRNVLGLSETYFPGATAIIPQEDYPDNIILQPLFYTSQDSWLEKDFDPLKEPEFNEGTDLKGPLSLGVLVAAAGETPEEDGMTRLVVIGDSAFASDQHFYNGDNGKLFLNLVELLTEGKELISIERKVLPFRRLVVSQETANFINISSISLLPLLVLLMGSIIWWRRR
ncbi:GldG family protein [Chloroflexota bacterium]